MREQLTLIHQMKNGVEYAVVEVPGEMIADTEGQPLALFTQSLGWGSLEGNVPILLVSSFLNEAMDKEPKIKSVLREAARAANKANYDFFTLTC